MTQYESQMINYVKQLWAMLNNQIPRISSVLSDISGVILPFLALILVFSILSYCVKGL